MQIVDADGGWPINLFLNHYICLIPDGFNIFFLISADKGKVKTVKFRSWGILFKHGLISGNVIIIIILYLIFALVRNFTLI